MNPTTKKLHAYRFAETVREATQIVSEPLPQLADNQVLIKNNFAGVNGLFDRAIVRNELPYRFLQPPLDLGVEAIGTVIAVGHQVKHLQKGDYVSTTRFGQGYKTFQVEEAQRVWKIPSLNPAYVALRPTAMSACVALEQVGQLRTKEVVAVTAAAGGLGQFVVQLAQLAGNRVIGICGGEEKVHFVKQLGCELVINYQTENVDELLKSHYPQGINLVYDTVGGDLFDVLVNNLANHGRLVVSGYAADMGKPGLPVPVTRPRVYEQIYWKAASIRCFQNALFPQYQDKASREVIDLYESGKLQVHLDPTPFIGIESVFDAIDYLCSGKSIGKVILQL